MGYVSSLEGSDTAASIYQVLSMYSLCLDFFWGGLRRNRENMD